MLRQTSVLNVMRRVPFFQPSRCSFLGSDRSLAATTSTLTLIMLISYFSYLLSYTAISLTFKIQLPFLTINKIPNLNLDSEMAAWLHIQRRRG